MSASDDPRRVHFKSPEHLVERFDALAEVFDTDRTELLVEAMRAYLAETEDGQQVRRLVAEKYYDDKLAFETVQRVVGTETAQRLRLLKRSLDAEPLELGEPGDTDVYGGAAATADPEADDTVGAGDREESEASDDAASDATDRRTTDEG